MNAEAGVPVGDTTLQAALQEQLRLDLPQRLRDFDRKLLGWKVKGGIGEDLHILLRESAREIETLRAALAPFVGEATQ